MWSPDAGGYQGGQTLSNGSIALTITDLGTSQGATGQHKPAVLADVQWTGPLGRNDEGEYVRLPIAFCQNSIH